MQPRVWSPILVAALASAATAAPMTMSMPAKPAEYAAFGEPGHTADRTVAIVAVDTRYLTSSVQVKLGETVRFAVTNRGKTAHEFVIGDAAFQAQHQREMAQMPGMKMDDPNEIELQPGQTKSLVWRFTKPGDFFFECDLPGHAAAGMIGKIHVQ